MKFYTLLPTLLSVAVGVGTSIAMAAPINDGAKLFSDQAVASANRTISQLQAKYGHGIRIETHETVPGGKAATVSNKSAAERNQFYSDWLKERAQTTHSEGLFLLMTRQPTHLQVGVSSSLRSAGFTSSQRQMLINRMTSAFKQGDFDRGLTDGLATIEQTFAGLATVGATRSIPVPAGRDHAEGKGLSMGMLLLIVGLVVGGLFLLSMVGRAFSGGPKDRHFGGYGGYGQSGGGGWLGSLLAGMGGAFAGNWLYDTFSGQRSAHADEPRHETDGGAAAQDESWASAGSDWGGDNGDFGGDDFGSGDSGGGDW
jgi:uncharacterized membrane protein YgcG